MFLQGHSFGGSSRADRPVLVLLFWVLNWVGIIFYMINSMRQKKDCLV